MSLYYHRSQRSKSFQMNYLFALDFSQYISNKQLHLEKRNKKYINFHQINYPELNESCSSSTSTNDSFMKFEYNTNYNVNKVVCCGETIYEGLKEAHKKPPRKQLKRFASTIFKAGPSTKLISLPQFL